MAWPVATRSRRSCVPRSCRDGLADHDEITTLLGVVTRLRRLGPPRWDRDRVGRHDQVTTARCVATSAVRQVRLLSSGTARVGRRRQGGKRGPRS
ncbi:hypothetical protein Taro_020102 [Colocasia esculenta]|uniref:Uncharacterized protein n=1 Tax=Colocasia esculenta TaxID=4460 RepID=A0A843UYP7_COLES|nr:hypothetical protein [Colocasia esculenta]